MLSIEQNDLITRTGPVAPAGKLMRCYWQPAALADELAGNRPVKPVRLLGEIFSLFCLYQFLAEHGIKVSVPQDLLTLDARGKRLVSQWLKEMSAHLAVAVRHVGMIVDPDAILVGGRLPIRMIDELLRYVHEHLDASDGALPSIHRASLGEDASAIGAAAMPMAALVASRWKSWAAGLRKAGSPVMLSTAPGTFALISAAPVQPRMPKSTRSSRLLWKTQLRGVIWLFSSIAAKAVVSARIELLRSIVAPFVARMPM